ncbi:capsid protein [Capybara virus 19_cap1_382]|nr:capsid protein [Capybara virus 19_cap1_382]
MKRKTYTNRPYKTTYKRRKYGTRTQVPKPLRQAIKKTMNRQLETKKHYEAQMTLSPMNGNTVYTSNLLCNITQGATENQRVGDRINLSRVHVSGEFSCKPTDNVFWHLYIFRTSNYSDQGTTVPGTIPYGNFFKNVTGNPNVDMPDPDQVRILKYKRIQCDVSNNQGTVIRRFYLSVNMKNVAYQYLTDGASGGRNYNLYFALVTRSNENNSIGQTESIIHYKDA